MLSKKEVHAILDLLKKMYPEAKCSLDMDGDDFHFLIRAILSAQCTDKRVNEVTSWLFDKYPDMDCFSHAHPDILGEDIRSCGLFRAKTKAIIGSSQILIEKFDRKIPSDARALESLPGVGRKIANLIRGEIYNVPAIVVDTHCIRVSRRIGLTDKKTPVLIEKDLASCIPKDEWITLGHRLVAHGRERCTAAKPSCERCDLNKVCVYAKESRLNSP